MTDDATAGVLLERITALETELIKARRESSDNLDRAIRAERRLTEADQRVAALEAAGREGRRWWRRAAGTGDGYHGLGTRIEQLLRLAEEQAADVRATARAEADQIRSAAVSDAARIREAAL